MKPSHNACASCSLCVCFSKGFEDTGKRHNTCINLEKREGSDFHPLSHDNMPPKAKKEDSTAANVGEEDDGFPSEETFKAQLEKNPDGKIALLHRIKFELLRNR